MFLTLAFLLSFTPGACADPAEAIALATPLVKRYEGLARCVGPASDPCAILTAYPDPGVGTRLPTIGYGHTSLAGGGLPVRMGTTITRREAEAILRADLAKTAEQVCRLVTAPLSARQLGALLSFTYNLGPGTLARSGIRRTLNAGKPEAAARDLTRYVYAGQPRRRLPGLVIRRQAEAELLSR